MPSDGFNLIKNTTDEPANRKQETVSKESSRTSRRFPAFKIPYFLCTWHPPIEKYQNTRVAIVGRSRIWQQKAKNVGIKIACDTPIELVNLRIQKKDLSLAYSLWHHPIAPTNSIYNRIRERFHKIVPRLKNWTCYKNTDISKDINKTSPKEVINLIDFPLNLSVTVIRLDRSLSL